MMFEIGQRVVCVDDRATDRRGLENYIVKGSVYTVRDVAVSEEILGIWVEEVENDPVQTTVGIMERGFTADRFRPLDERRLDVFREMLNDIPKETEPA